MMRVMRLMMNNLLRKQERLKLRNRSEKIKGEKDHLSYHPTLKAKLNWINQIRRKLQT